MAQAVAVVGPAVVGSETVLTAAALEFIGALERQFRGQRATILARRRERQAALDAGGSLGLLAMTEAIRRHATWRVAETPPDLLDRRVEITGPAEPKMMINALNSSARVFMADLEDALAPTWGNVVGGQVALRAAVRGTLAHTAPDGRKYRIGPSPAVLLVRPRGWHLEERHVLVGGAPVSASLFDAGLYLFHNAVERLARGTGPYLYLPKLQSHLEARLWNEVLVWAQDALGIPRGSVRATVLIETLPAAFEMEEILWELREHASGLNAGRWDYLFSCIKTFGARPDRVLPDRSQLAMTVPFMRAYTERLVRTCHRRDAHAIGGMAAFIPSRRNAVVNERAMARVRDDKERESRDGFDGTWVAHPDLVPLATEVFDGVLGASTDQRERRSGELDPVTGQVAGDPADLLDFALSGLAGSGVTEAGVRLNVSVALRYLDSWLRGTGAAAIDDLMEDAATAEISRSQLWQWRVTGTPLDDGLPLTAARYSAIRDDVLAGIGGRDSGRLADAAELLDRLVLADAMPEFLTLDAYRLLD